MEIKLILEYSSCKFLNNFLENLDEWDEDRMEGDKKGRFYSQLPDFNFIEDLLEEENVHVVYTKKATSVLATIVVYCGSQSEIDLIKTRIKNIDCKEQCENCVLFEMEDSISDCCYTLRNMYAQGHVVFKIK